MKEIRMVDLKSQYQKIKTAVDSSIAEVIENTEFINGSQVKNFQQNLENYLGVKHVIPCGNGTDALQIALMSLGLKAGDEVITSDFTFIATLEVIALLGLKPVIADVDPHTFNISVESLKKAVTPKTKAIIPVHLFGQCADMDAIMTIARKHSIAVVEDCAQAMGATYTYNGKPAHAGTIGDLGCTSFFPSKNLGCYGDGGAIMTNNDELAKMCRSIANHGMKVRYYHDHVGVNSRLDTIQAAVLNVKLQYLDEYNKSRQEAAAFYDTAFSSSDKLCVPSRNSQSTHIFHQYTLVLRGIDREALRTHLQHKGIPAMIYYPVPLHLQNAYKDLGYKEGDFPVTEQLCKSVISLPMHTELDTEQLEYITKSVLEFLS
ncbi:MAG: DegT/DnrJ/EryC1/StrS family aminotransferase [Bacteroidota bacterium]|nr:DegT/DnrJ/EryC1/StrS family aminotransferase [Bacteroidota bacterium]